MKRFVNCVLFIVCISLSAQDDRETIARIDSLGINAYNYFNENDYVNAYNHFSSLLEISDSLNDRHSIALASLNLGKIYYHTKAYNKAENSYVRSLSVAQLTHDKCLIANAYLHLGELAAQTHKTEEQLAYFEKALLYASKIKDEDKNTKKYAESIKFKINTNLTFLYLKKGQLDKGFDYLNKAKQNLDKIPLNPFFKAHYNFAHGKYFEKRKEFNNANSKYRVAIGILKDNTINSLASSQLLLGKIYNSLANSYSQLGNHQNAYKSLLKHNRANAVFLEQNQLLKKNITTLKLDIPEHKNTIGFEHNQLELHEQATSRIKIFSIITVLAIIVLLILTLTLYNNFKANVKLSKMLKLRNIELEKSKKEAEVSSQLKTQFISNVTHELRTPLYGVVGLSTLLLNGKDLSEKEFKYIKSIKYSADYLLQLVNDVLQMGKMESGTVALKNVPTNLNVMLKDIVATFENRLQETNNTLKTQVDKSIPNMLDFDKVRLTQVLVNLIGNSIKFTQNGNIYLRVKQINSPDSKIHLKFEVEDNGSGISKKDQKIIFQNFTQLVDKNNSKYQGTGLGLPIAKSLVKLFGGSIKLKSMVDVGSTFSFTIAVEKSVIKAQDTLNIKHHEPKQIAQNEKYKVLVAEDNKINQIVTRNLLEAENFECHVVNDGAEALAEFKNHKFDLILMDINMPVMGGNEATKKIREINPNIPIIALTAADIEEVENDYKSIGYSDVITKPFDNHSFFQKVVERIQESKLKTELPSV